MGNFERLSVLVIVVVIVMILIVALVQLTNDPGDSAVKDAGTSVATNPGPAPLAGPSPSARIDNGLVVPPSAKPPAAMSSHAAPPPAPAASASQGPDDIFRLQSADASAPPTVGVGDAAPTPAAAPKPAEPTFYVVQPGDTIARIAKKLFPGNAVKGTDAILKANPSVDPNRMREGTKLTIPSLAAAPGAPGIEPAAVATRPPTATPSLAPGGTYTVKSGDTLPSIARRAYGATARWHEIWLANYEAVGDDVDHPRAGTRLAIPK